MVNASTGRGRVSLITGSSAAKGMGYSHARVFAREGAKIIISDVSNKEKEGRARVAELDAMHGAGTAIWIPLDVTSEEQWERAVGEIEDKFGPLDVAVLNAGIAGPVHAPGETLDMMDVKVYRTIAEVNEFGVVMGLKWAAASMKKNNVEEWKSIVTVSSGAGIMAANLGPHMGYFGSKWAVRGISKVAAGLGAPLKIRVNALHPTNTVTDMTASIGWVDGETGKHAPALDGMVNSWHIKRFAFPEEVSNVCLLLAGTEGSYLSGQSFVVDGGFINSH
ncbi:short-chain dehydrogenase/reductase SDR [Hyaloraphidium curvatum]|nr:short-chain dehydrogenase/reductase SDR [Hyaloraphidium curvatum]